MKVDLCCPDTNRRRPEDRLIPVGGLGEPAKAPYHFDQCPAYWLREPWKYGLHLPWAVDARTAYKVAVESRYSFEHGHLCDFQEMPGALADAVLLLINEEGRLTRLRIEKDRAAAKGKRGAIKVV